MARDKRRDYSVGFGKPPAHARFQKGASGNPKGRPKGAKNYETQFIEEVNAPIPIVENGKRLVISKFRAAAKQMVNKAASGDARAAERVLDRVQRIEAGGEVGRQPTFSDADREVINAIYARLAAKKEPGQ